jgi:hypothetical protein
MIPRIFYPHHVDDLIRLGNKFDGGYVVSRKIIKQCSQCVSFGLGDNLTFEIDLQKKIIISNFLFTIIQSTMFFGLSIFLLAMEIIKI